MRAAVFRDEFQNNSAVYVLGLFGPCVRFDQVSKSSPILVVGRLNASRFSRTCFFTRVGFHLGPTNVRISGRTIIGNKFVLLTRGDRSVRGCTVQTHLWRARVRVRVYFGVNNSRPRSVHMPTTTPLLITGPVRFWRSFPAPARHRSTGILIKHRIDPAEKSTYY